MHLAAALEKSTLRRISNFLLILLSNIPVAMSVPGLLDAIGLFTDEELARTCEDKFVAEDFNFATIISTPFCSCILFAIVLEQLIKLEFLAQFCMFG